MLVIPGDGIGPEVTVAARRVLDASGLSAEWIEAVAGATAIEQGHDNVLPEQTLKAIRTHGAKMESR